MSAIPEIRHHIQVVGDTRKITRAMYLIASAKLKKAMRMLEANHAYFARVRSDIAYILENTEAYAGNPYFTLRKGGRCAYIVISGDKGMCGSYNTDVIRLAERAIARPSHEGTHLFTIGQTGAEYFEKKGMRVDFTYLNIIQNPSLHNARAIAEGLVALYDRKRLDEIYVIYTEMQSTMKLRPRALRLLPVLPGDFAEVEILHQHAPDVVYHPGPGEVLSGLVPQYIIGQMYTCLVQAYASEHSARMMAMDASTRNADEMIGKLKLELNRARQSVITQELIEIISGANATE